MKDGLAMARNWGVCMILAVVAVLLFGCSHYEASFRDSDTTFTSKLMLAPFSKLDGQDAKMQYDIINRPDGPQDIRISVGAGLQGLDQTKQVDALGIVGDLLAKAILGYVGKAQIDANENIRLQELENEIKKLELELKEAKEEKEPEEPEENISTISIDGGFILEVEPNGLWRT